MIRRLVTASIATALGVGLLCASAAADETIDDGEWAGSHVTRPVPVTSDPGTTRIDGAFVRDRIYGQPTIVITVSPPAGLAASCPHNGTRTFEVTGTPEGGSAFGTNRYRFALDVAFGPRVCNGAYAVTIVARVVGDDPRLTTSIEVAAPPAPVLGVTAEEAGDRAVDVTWSAPVEPPPDLIGFAVIRSASSDETVFHVDDPSATSFTDDELPAEGGTLEYRVVARRWAPSGEVTGTGGEAVQPVTVAPAPPSEDDGPGDDGSGTDDGDGDAGAGSRRPGTGSSRPRVRAPLIGAVSSGVVPPLLRPSPPTTADDGFSDTLPFEDAEPGGAEAVPPGDELASAFYEGDAGRGLVIPIATALVLAVWAFHLRYLSKAARPVS